MKTKLIDVLAITPGSSDRVLNLIREGFQAYRERYGRKPEEILVPWEVFFERIRPESLAKIAAAGECDDVDNIVDITTYLDVPFVVYVSFRDGLFEQGKDFEGKIILW